MIFALALLAGAWGAPAICPMPGTVGDCVLFRFNWPQAAVPKYTMVVQEDRLVHYWPGDGPYDAEERAKPTLTVSKSTLETIFAAEKSRSFPACETRLKGIAQTGLKTIDFVHGDEESACTFNFSEDERIQAATAALMAMAQTMQFGEELARLRRFDRIGLDAEIDAVAESVKAGRAIEVENIAPVLQSIVDDDRVIERVRRKAARLLQDADSAR